MIKVVRTTSDSKDFKELAKKLGQELKLIYGSTNGKYVSYLGIACGLTAILFVGILSSDLHSKVVGLYQRIIEGSVLVWLVVCSFYLRTSHIER